MDPAATEQPSTTNRNAILAHLLRAVDQSGGVDAAAQSHGGMKLNLFTSAAGPLMDSAMLELMHSSPPLAHFQAEVLDSDFAVAKVEQGFATKHGSSNHRESGEQIYRRALVTR